MATFWHAACVGALSRGGRGVVMVAEWRVC